MSPRRHARSAIPLLALGIWACEGEGPVVPDPVATAIAVEDWNGQLGVAGAALSEPVVFAVFDDTDEDSVPVAGVPVTIEVVAGGGTVASGPFVSDDDGLVSVAWTLGTTAGVQQLRASIGVDTAFATATARPGPVAQIQKIGGEAQEGPAGSELPDSLVVRVVDGFDNPIENALVVWAAPGGGTVTPVTTTTDATGLAAAAWRLGGASGPQAVTASVGAISTVFNATAESGSGSVASLEIVSGDDQTDTVATALPAPLAVRALDAFGNAVAAVPVTFVVTSGGGSVFVGTTTTNAQGVAHEQWTLGTSTATAQIVEARAIAPGSGAPLVAAFSATAVAAAPERVEFVSVPGSGTVGEPLSSPVTARTMDRYGNPTAGATVEWTPLNGGSVTPVTSASDASGIASTSWTLGSTPGVQRLRVALGAHADTTGTSAAATQPRAVEIAGGDNQMGPVGGTLPVQLIVRVLDQFGNPVTGVAPQWIVPAGHGIGQTSPSDVNGYARARWTLGTVTGQQHVTATAGGDSVTFTATVTPGPLNSLAINPTGAVLDHVGDTVRFVAEGHDVYGNPIPGLAVTWTTNDSAVASVTSAGLVTARAQGLVAIEARHSSGRVGTALVEVPLFGSESVLPLTTASVPEAFQMVGDYLLYRHQPPGQSQVKETVLHRINTGEVVWRVTIEGEVALGDRYAITTSNGDTHVYDLLTGTETQFEDVDGPYTFGAVRPSTSSDWIGYEAYTGLPLVSALRQGIRVQNQVTGETRYVTTSRSASAGFTCSGRPVFDYPYLAWVDSGWVRVYDVASATSTPVAMASPSYLSLSGTRVAWSTGSTITIHDLGTGAVTASVADAEVTCLEIDDDIVAWSAAPAGARSTHDIFMRDLGTGETTRVTHTQTRSERFFSLDAGRLLFQTTAAGAQLHVFDPH